MKDKQDEASQVQLPADMIVDYATGTVTPGLHLLLSAHMRSAGECAAKIADIEAVGGAFLEAEAPACMRDQALDSVLSDLDLPDPDAAEDALDAGPLPQAVIKAVGVDFDRIDWKFRLPGLSEYELSGFGAEEKVSLLRARPGRTMPRHTHDGREMTLVLTGLLEDGDRIYGPGEIAVSDDRTDHAPRIVGNEICHCLVVLSGNLRFTGTFSRALNYLAE